MLDDLRHLLWYLIPILKPKVSESIAEIVRKVFPADQQELARRFYDSIPDLQEEYISLFHQEEAPDATKNEIGLLKNWFDGDLDIVLVWPPQLEQGEWTIGYNNDSSSIVVETRTGAIAEVDGVMGPAHWNRPCWKDWLFGDHPLEEYRVTIAADFQEFLSRLHAAGWKPNFDFP